MSRALFLDRDGVINQRIPDGYVTRKEDFVVLPGVLEALALLTPQFDYTFIVTNQQGIGKGLMTEEDLNGIHAYFIQQATAEGGRIDKVYFCPHLKSEHSFMRKPSIGMALKAKKDHPGLNLKQSVMVGDTLSDMVFGRRAGMKTVLVGDEYHIARSAPHSVDSYYENLLSFAKHYCTQAIQGQ
ncbi:MAG: HAD family hydrolase [Bacteroidales bacterium]|nr:HAD family hydrolase [Bacteroidales bacterium]